MAFSGLDIYKLLPKTNCRDCGFVTCLAFAMQLAKKAVVLEKCPHLKEETKKVLENSSLPPIRLVNIGVGEHKLEVGNETVLFRHEEKFHRPCGLGFIIEDNLSDTEIRQRLKRIGNLKFERIGQELRPELIAIRQQGNKQRFLEVIKLAIESNNFALILMSSDLEAQNEALSLIADKKPLIYNTGENNIMEFAKLARDFRVPLVASSPEIAKLSLITQELNNQGLNDLLLDTGQKPIASKIWDLTQIRRLALKKGKRNLGYPVLVVVDKDDPYEEAIEAATYIAKYAGIVLIKGIESWQTLSLLTLRQNIYTDPQKPLQIEAKLYCVGSANPHSPVLVTTNFSLSYYTVLGEVEASKAPSYIMSVDTEGMSVLTAWAAEKFTPEKINDSLIKFNVKEKVAHNNIIIPGYVAVISGDLEEQSGWRVIVGPKEASGIPAFLKNLK